MLNPNAHYGAWLQYRNADDNRSGEPISGEIVLSQNEPTVIDGAHWAKIGAFTTNEIGNIFFFDKAG